MSEYIPPPEVPNSGDVNPYGFSSEAAIPVTMSQLGIIRQVPTLGVLMAVQGGLVCAVGLMLVALGAFFPFMLEMQAQQPGAVPPPGNIEVLMLAIYGGMGVLLLLFGAVTIYSGVKLYNFQNRVLAMIMLASGLITILSCYCLPTAIALGIFGYIVLTKGPVIQAFRIAEGRKMTADEIVMELEKRVREGAFTL